MRSGERSDEVARWQYRNKSTSRTRRPNSEIYWRARCPTVHRPRRVYVPRPSSIQRRQPRIRRTYGGNVGMCLSFPARAEKRTPIPSLSRRSRPEGFGLEKTEKSGYKRTRPLEGPKRHTRGSGALCYLCSSGGEVALKEVKVTRLLMIIDFDTHARSQEATA